MRPLLFLIPILALPSCANMTMPEQNAAELAALPAASACEASLPFFGHFINAGERIPMYAEPDGRITMRNDGGWCSIRHQLVLNNTAVIGTFNLLQPPAHGQVVVGTLQGLARIAYRPEPGFVGNDEFSVRVTNPMRDTIPVRVSVRP